MKSTEILSDLGLTKAEAEVYLALLRMGGVKASTVACDIGVKRTTIYAILKSLSMKGFVATYFRKSTQLYYAERPERVKYYFEKKLSSFENLLPTLQNLAKKDLKIDGVRLISTINELKFFYQNILIECKRKSYSIIGNTQAWQDYAPEFFQKFRRERAVAKIKTQLLLTHDSAEVNHLDNTNLLRDIKYLPAKYNFNSTIDIFDDKILIVGPELSALAVVIAISPMVDVFKVVFQLLWDLLPTGVNTPQSSRPLTSPTPPRPHPPARSTTARARTARRSGG